ncbi:transcription elongation factor S-II [Xylariaceae sp. FL1019]|nr:transcription elongation factor S-II [Xylariaceae sp. FL1019]
MPAPTREELLQAATSFCDSFAQKKPLEEILSHFPSPSSRTSQTPHSQSNNNENQAQKRNEIIVHEHGLPELAPFLGRDFTGLAGAREYFEIVGQCLEYEDMRFVEYIVDPNPRTETNEGSGEDRVNGGGKVVVRGKARFTWKETKQSWDETFVYILCFDDSAKVTKYEVWADSGAAYLARRGALGK